MSASDANSTNLSASGAVFGGPARVVGISYVASATAGTITIKDGGSAGASKLVIDTPALATASGYIGLSHTPIRCQTSAYCTISNVTKVTVLYA